MASPQYNPSTSSQSASSNIVATPEHTPPTPQYLQQWDSQQASARRNRTGVRAHRSHGHRAHGNTGNSDTSVTQGQYSDSDTGMTPIERFEASTEDPYQPQSQYQPVSSSLGQQQVGTPHYRSSTAYHTYLPSSAGTHSDPITMYSNFDQGSTYWSCPSPQVLPPGADTTDWGYDLAGVGTRFDNSQDKQTYTPCVAGHANARAWR